MKVLINAGRRESWVFIDLMTNQLRADEVSKW